MWQLFEIFGACGKSFFGIPPWYKYIEAAGKLNGDCQVVKFNIPADLSLVVLGILDILLRIAGLAAVGFVIYGGIQYVVSQGEPDRTKKALGTIVNACIGLAIALIAVAFVSFIGNAVGK